MLNDTWNNSEEDFKNQEQNEKIKEKFFNDPQIRATVLKKSRYLANRFKGLKSANDIEGELYVELLKSSKRYDSKKGSFHAFFGTVICNCVANYFRQNDPKKLEKRPKFQSLTPLIEYDDARLADAKYDPAEIVEKEDFNQKVQQVMADMPEELRQICFLRIELSSFAAVARKLGISKKAMDSKWTAIEKCFLKAGYNHTLKDFFKKGGA